MQRLLFIAAIAFSAAFAFGLGLLVVTQFAPKAPEPELPPIIVE